MITVRVYKVGSNFGLSVSVEQYRGRGGRIRIRIRIRPSARGRLHEAGRQGSGAGQGPQGGGRWLLCGGVARRSGCGTAIREFAPYCIRRDNKTPPHAHTHARTRSHARTPTNAHSGVMRYVFGVSGNRGAG